MHMPCRCLAHVVYYCCQTCGCVYADFELMAQQFTKGRLMKNTIKDTKAMLANAEYYVRTMERTLERGSKYVRHQQMTMHLSC